LRNGDESAAHRLLPILYDQFHALAETYLRHEPDIRCSRRRWCTRRF
jgi:hypothetical protein